MTVGQLKHILIVFLNKFLNQSLNQLLNKLLNKLLSLPRQNGLQKFGKKTTRGEGSRNCTGKEIHLTLSLAGGKDLVNRQSSVSLCFLCLRVRGLGAVCTM